MQGTSFAFVGVLAGVAATQGLGVALTACIIGGVILRIKNNFKRFARLFKSASISWPWTLTVPKSNVTVAMPSF
jgi:xanthine/uracil permease